MELVKSIDSNSQWLHLMVDCVQNGVLCESRGLAYKELIAMQTNWDMTEPIVNNFIRKPGFKFMAREAFWILSGKSDVASIQDYSKRIAEFSDSGIHYFGAYGPKFVQQIEYIMLAFKKDLFTRQAVVNVWRESPMASKDIPCTLSLQFLIRENNGFKQMHCIATMRSSDIWLGVPYDVFNFSMMSAYLALCLRQAWGIDVNLGTLCLTAGSQHLYLTDIESHGLHSSRITDTFDTASGEKYRLNLKDYTYGVDLIQELECISKGEQLNGFMSGLV